ncbi:hypothetical protein OEA41_005864 [Lepraria neglecta]|uniref:lipoyl(octanoyl) transferase n=1 Tax=Lepraria neglecta TaxID=209136 RepID=A0AAE0DJQ1_9LECA|nr:hypothetical protein OEA41_005864 [Lepraria neglecta]
MNRLVSLRHLHLPGLTPYLRASAIQEYLVQVQLDHKAAEPILPAPSPVLVTFQTPPTYTTGRREAPYLTVSQIAHLRADGKAEYHPALRGGQTTFHGPGQITAYLVLNLKAHSLDVRSHVKLLEESTIGTCTHYGLDTFTTSNPGVWTGPRPGERKLASLGVHVRRRITSHGLGINVGVDLEWFDRIVMCGLKGMRATNIEREIEARRAMGGGGAKGADGKISIRGVADILAGNVAKRLAGVDGRVENVAEMDVWPDRDRANSNHVL